MKSLISLLLLILVLFISGCVEQDSSLQYKEAEAIAKNVFLGPEDLAYDWKLSNPPFVKEGVDFIVEDPFIYSRGDVNPIYSFGRSMKSDSENVELLQLLRIYGNDKNLNSIQTEKLNNDFKKLTSQTEYITFLKGRTVYYYYSQTHGDTYIFKEGNYIFEINANCNNSTCTSKNSYTHMVNNTENCYLDEEGKNSKLACILTAMVMDRL